jgi:uncharacterized membrane protein YkoI
MKRSTKIATGAALAVALAGGGGAIAIAGDAPDDAEAPIRGDALSQASEAALDHTGGGRVTETEVGDEESYYEVEVTRDDGSQVDVQLDRDFEVVGDEVDREDEPGDDDEG